MNFNEPLGKTTKSEVPANGHITESVLRPGDGVGKEGF